MVAGQEAVIPHLGGAGPRAFRIRIQPPPPGEPGGQADALQRFLINFQDGDDVAGVGPRIANPVQINVFPHQPNNARAAPRGALQPQANDVIINNMDIPPLVRPIPLNQPVENEQGQPQVPEPGDGRGAYNNLLRQLMPMLERAQMVNPIPIRRALAPGPEDPNVDEDVFHQPLPVRLPPFRMRVGPGFMQAPRPAERETRPTRHQNTERDELAAQIQQIIASVQQENVANASPQNNGNKVDEPQPSTSTQSETNRVEEISKSIEEKEEEINELIRRREGQEQALIDAMRNVMEVAGDNGELKRKAVPIFLRLQAEELKARRKMIDLRERIVSGGEAEIAEAEKKVQNVLQELEEYEQNALKELKNVKARDGNEKNNEEPQPCTSAQTAKETVPSETIEVDAPAPPVLGLRTRDTTAKDASEEEEENKEDKNEQTGEVRARIQTMVRQRQQEGVNLHQALRDAIAQGGNDAEIQERLQPILMRLDTDELTAMHRILEVLHECIAEGLNPGQVEQRLQNIVDRQREDERTALEAMQAVVTQQRNQQQQSATVFAGNVSLQVVVVK